MATSTINKIKVGSTTYDLTATDVTIDSRISELRTYAGRYDEDDNKLVTRNDAEEIIAAVISRDAEEKTVTPTATTQVITPSSGSLLKKVTVNGDSDLAAGNIKEGVSIFGVTGTYSGITPTGTYDITRISDNSIDITDKQYVTINDNLIIEKDINLSTIEANVNIDLDHHSAAIVTNSDGIDCAVTLQDVINGEIECVDSEITLMNDGDNTITFNSYTGNVYDICDSGSIVESIFSTQISEPSGEVLDTINPGVSDKYSKAINNALVTANNYVKVNGDANLVAGNIKEGVSIFGVTGTHRGSSTLTGDATPNDVIIGKTFYSNDPDTKLTGTVDKLAITTSAGARSDLRGTVTSSGTDQYIVGLLTDRNYYWAPSSYIKVAAAPSASNLSIAGVSNTDAVSVGTLSSGYYPVNAKVKASVSPETAGWLSTGGTGTLTASSTSQVGKIVAGSFATTTSTASATALAASTKYKLAKGYYADDAYYTTPNGGITPSGTLSLTSNTSTDVTNYSTVDFASTFSLSNDQAQLYNQGSLGTLFNDSNIGSLNNTGKILAGTNSWAIGSSSSPLTNTGIIYLGQNGTTATGEVYYKDNGGTETKLVQNGVIKQSSWITGMSGTSLIATINPGMSDEYVKCSESGWTDSTKYIKVNNVAGHLNCLPTISKEGQTYGWVWNDHEHGLCPENSKTIHGSGLANSFAYGKLYFNLSTACNIKIEYYQASESGYDYMILSNIGQELEKSNTADSTYAHSTKNVSGNGNYTYSNVTVGQKYITIKYRKDANGDSDLDYCRINSITITPTNNENSSFKVLAGDIVNANWTTSTAAPSSTIATITPGTGAQYVKTSTGGWINSDTGIKINAAPTGSATPSASYATLSSAGTSATSVTSRYFKITPTASVGTAGWISSISNGTVQNYTVRQGSATLTASVTTTGSSTNSYTAKVTPSASVGTAGWISSISNGTALSVTPTNLGLTEASDSNVTINSTTGAMTLGAGFYTSNALTKSTTQTTSFSTSTTAKTNTLATIYPSTSTQYAYPSSGGWVQNSYAVAVNPVNHLKNISSKFSTTSWNTYSGSSSQSYVWIKATTTNWYYTTRGCNGYDSTSNRLTNGTTINGNKCCGSIAYIPTTTGASYGIVVSITGYFTSGYTFNIGLSTSTSTAPSTWMVTCNPTTSGAGTFTCYIYRNSGSTFYYDWELNLFNK